MCREQPGKSYAVFLLYIFSYSQKEIIEGYLQQQPELPADCRGKGGGEHGREAMGP